MHTGGVAGRGGGTRYGIGLDTSFGKSGGMEEQCNSEALGRYLLAKTSESITVSQTSHSHLGPEPFEPAKRAPIQHLYLHLRHHLTLTLHLSHSTIPSRKLRWLLRLLPSTNPKRRRAHDYILQGAFVGVLSFSLMEGGMADTGVKGVRHVRSGGKS